MKFWVVFPHYTCTLPPPPTRPFSTRRPSAPGSHRCLDLVSLPGTSVSRHPFSSVGLVVSWHRRSVDLQVGQATALCPSDDLLFPRRVGESRHYEDVFRPRPRGPVSSKETRNHRSRHITLVLREGGSNAPLLYSSKDTFEKHSTMYDPSTRRSTLSPYSRVRTTVEEEEGDPDPSTLEFTPPPLRVGWDSRATSPTGTSHATKIKNGSETHPPRRGPFLWKEGGIPRLGRPPPRRSSSGPDPRSTRTFLRRDPSRTTLRRETPGPSRRVGSGTGRRKLPT